MKAHILQHVAFEGPGSIQSWLAARGAEVTDTRFFEDAALLPDPCGLDLIIALGGPMSVNDEVSLPWLVAEKQFLAAAIQAGKAVLGICLGAQLMANALGARVVPGLEREIGWFSIEAAITQEDQFTFPPSLLAFHWHGETFDLPQGAVRLASSAGCANQAFQWGARAIGLQFHLETTPESARRLLENSRHELIPGKYVQSESQLLQASAAQYAEMNRWMDLILTYLTRS